MDGADFLIRDHDVRVRVFGHHTLRIGDHVRRNVALVDAHAEHHFLVDAEGLRLFDRNHAVLPICFMTSAMILPISGSLAEMVATFSISSSLTGLAIFSRIPS